MMVAVAIVALLFATIFPMVQRLRFLARRSAFIAIAEQHLVLMGHERSTWFGDGRPTIREYLKRDGTLISQAKHDHHELLWEKYWKAADNPWFPVEPDPPEPP